MHFVVVCVINAWVFLLDAGFLFVSCPGRKHIFEKPILQMTEQFLSLNLWQIIKTTKIAF